MCWVPPGTFPRPDGLTPLSVRNSNGNLVPTQVEVVGRFADDSLGADVVELIARMPRPAGAVTGERVQFEVVSSAKLERQSAQIIW